MRNKLIIDRVVEAIECRGFSKAEAVQMVRRIKDGKGELPEIKVDPATAEEIYKNGFQAGMKAEQARQQHAAARAQQEAYLRYQRGIAGMGEQAAYGNSQQGLYSGIFRGGY